MSSFSIICDGPERSYPEKSHRRDFFPDDIHCCTCSQVIISMSSNPSRPLLRHSEVDEDEDEHNCIKQYGTGQQEEVVEGDEAPNTPKHGQAEIIKEIGLVVKTTAPIIASYALQYGLTLTTISVVGHLGRNELAAAALALTTANVTGFAVFEGMNTALDTLCSQAYGAGKLEMVGIYLQRMICLLFLATIPISAVWMCSPQLLALFIPELEIAEMAGNFLRVMLMGAPGLALFEAGRRFLQAQGLFQGPLLATIIALPTNIVLNWLFVHRLEYGFLGAAMALSITRLTLPVLLVTYVLLIQPSCLECWTGVRSSVFKDWGHMVRLAGAGIVTVETEWLAFEILTIAAAYLSPTHLAAQSVVMTISDIMSHISFSIAVSIATRFGNLVGAGNLSAAKVAAQTFYLVAIVIGISNGLLVLTFREPILRFFSNDRAVLDVASEAIPVISVVLFFDATAAVMNGLLRGLGRQSVGAWINLAIHYMVRFFNLSTLLCPASLDGLTSPSLGWSPSRSDTVLWVAASGPAWLVDGNPCRAGIDHHSWLRLLQVVRLEESRGSGPEKKVKNDSRLKLD